MPANFPPAGGGGGGGGDASAANQVTGNSTLAAIDGHVDGVETLLAGGLPAALATGGALKADLTTILGTAPAVNSGSLSAGTLRVTLATDQVALTNPLLVTPGGNVASGATDSGNPLKTGGVYNSTAPTFTNGQRGDVQLGTRGSVNIQVRDANGTNQAAVAAPADGTTGQTGLAVTSEPGLFNGTSWDRWRGNVELTLLASAARTTTTASSDQTNYNGLGGHIIINVSANGGAFSITPTIQGKDPISGTYYTILAGPAITSNGITILKVYPGILQSVNSAASDILPRTFRINCVPTDSTSITYSVAAVVML